MPRQNLIPFRTKHKGLWVNGPREQTPQDNLRRLTGAHAIRTREIRTRNGTTADATVAAAHSLFKFEGTRYQGAGTDLFRAGASISSIFDGTPLEFSANNPRVGTNLEYLFVSGGGDLQKVEPTSVGGAVIQWGISPPSTGVWGTDPGGNSETTSGATTGAPQRDDVIAAGDQTNIDRATFVPVASFPNSIIGNSVVSTTSTDVIAPAGTALRLEATGVSSSFSPVHSIRYEFSPSLDLTTFPTSGDPSSNQDLIELWFNFREGKVTTSAFIQFVFRSGSFLPSAPASIFRIGASQGALSGALGSAGALPQNEDDIVSGSTSALESAQSLSDISARFVPGNGWQRVRFPKTAIVNNVTPAGPIDLSDITVIEVSFAFAGSSRASRYILEVADHVLVGGGSDTGGTPPAGKSAGGLTGDYRYRVTFRNSETGNRSNPGPAVVVAKDIDRGFVTLTGLPVSADPQVDQIEIWRTLGNGSRFFLNTRLANGTTTYTDNVADFAGTDDTEGVDILGSEELPLDNDVPDDDFDQHIIDRLTTFWISSGTGKRGRVFFSPVGRPESFKGFIEVSSTSDRLTRLVVFQGTRYVFSEERVFKIEGEDPYVARVVSGVPGVSFANRRTVVVTPFGILYQANDGIRRFDGFKSILVNFDAVGQVFRGEAAENLTAFEGTVATFARGEYIVSTGTQDLAVEVETGNYRNPGFGDITSYYYEWDADKIQAGRTSQVELIEEEGVFADDGGAISLAWETPALDFPNDQVIMTERIYTDINPAGATITPTVVHLDGTITLDTIATAARGRVQTNVERLLRKPGVRYTGSGTSQVTLFDSELEFRQVVLGVKFPNGDRIEIPGRTNNIETQITFEIDPPDRRLDGELFIPLIELIAVDINTGGNTITPVILAGDENTVTLTGFSTTQRETVETTVDQNHKVRGVQLLGDFTANVQLFGVELHIRNIPLGLTVIQ